MYFWYNGTTPTLAKCASDGSLYVVTSSGAHDLLQAMLSVETTSVSAPYVVVDLSDTTNFPHSATTNLFLKALSLDADITGDGQFKIKVGVVTENDASDGSVEWIHMFRAETTENATDDTRHISETETFAIGGDTNGLNLTVSSGSLSYAVTNLTTASDATWRSGKNMTSPIGSTTNPGAGDLVAALLPKTGQTGSIAFTIKAIYGAE